MPNQNDLAMMTRWTDTDLSPSIPTAETQEYEFKCSLTLDGELTPKIQKAASGFWNSGGGYLVLGVDGTGKPDGGIPTSVGRQPRKDWLDRVIRSVAPPFPGGYAVNEIPDNGNGLNIKAGNAVYVIGFSNSEIVPHMAPDGRYYIRSGAHTTPAPAFIVEALFARRGKRQPQLRIQVRRHPLYSWVLQLGIANVSLVPAIDVEIEFEKPPKTVRVDQARGKAIERVNLIDRDAPFYLDYADRSPTKGDQTPDVLLTDENHVTLRYRDPFLQQYEETLPVNPGQAVAVSHRDGTVLDSMARTLEKISSTLSNIERRLK